MTTTFQLTGYLNAAGNVTHIQATTIVATFDEAVKIAASLKSCGVKASHLSGSQAGTGYLKLFVTILSNGVNGGRNEAGIKKVRKLMTKANVEVVKDQAGNAATPEQIMAAL